MALGADRRRVPLGRPRPGDDHRRVGRRQRHGFLTSRAGDRSHDAVRRCRAGPGPRRPAGRRRAHLRVGAPPFHLRRRAAGHALRRRRPDAGGRWRLGLARLSSDRFEWFSIVGPSLRAEVSWAAR